MAGIVDTTKAYLFFGALNEFRSVSIVSVKNSGNDPAVTCNYAVRGKVSFRILQALSAAVVRPECMYSIPMDVAPGPWKPGDTLTDANQIDATSQTSPGVTYVVQLTEMDEGFWLLYCFNPKISFNLKDTCTIKVATDGGPNAIGMNPRTFADLYTSVPCRVQPTSSVWSMSHGRVGDLKTFDVYIASDYDLHPSKHIVTWTSGATTYEADVVNVQSRESVADLMAVTVELRAGTTGAV